MSPLIPGLAEAGRGFILTGALIQNFILTFNHNHPKWSQYNTGISFILVKHANKSTNKGYQKTVEILPCCFALRNATSTLNDHQHLETPQTNIFTVFVLVKLNKGSVSSVEAHFMFKVKYGWLEKSIIAKYTRLGDIDLRCLSEREITSYWTLARRVEVKYSVTYDTNLTFAVLLEPSRSLKLKTSL